MTDRHAELLIVGRVATLAGTSGLGWVEAVAVAGGRVMASGTASELAALRGPATEVWRLGADQAVMPGITDAHLHLTMLAAARDQVDLSGVAGLEACLAALAEAHQRLTADGRHEAWLLGHGWSVAQLGRWPDAQMLEQVAPGRAVALWAHDHHSRWVSAAALQLAGIDEQATDPEGGLIRRDERGAPTGVLHETAAGLINHVVPVADLPWLASALIETAAELAALGVTACHDPNELEVDAGIGRAQELYRSLARGGRLPLRVHASIRDHHLGPAIAAGLRSGDGVAAEARDDALAQRHAERYRMGWLKLFSDGSLGSRSAALLEPYADAADRPPTGGSAGMLLHAPEALRELLTRAAAAGIAGQVHAIGDAAVRLALDLLADAPALPLRPRVEHAQLVHPDDVPRFGQLRVAASVQPVHLRSDAEIARAAWGPRAELAFPLRGLDDGRALIPFGTDAPVEPSDPWPGIAVAVARRDPLRPGDAPLGGEQAIGLPRAIRAACLDPAMVAGEDDRGRLVGGQRADMLVVPLRALDGTADPAELAATRPLAALIDGQPVHRAPEFDPSS